MSKIRIFHRPSPALPENVYTPGVHKKPYKKSSKIKQIQLEQDSGKSLHDHVDKRSLVDLNRAGAPLIELVFEPDLSDGEEAAALVKELVLIVQRLGACTGRMEEGALRVDANVSLRREGEPLSTRTEIKNIGSIRGVANAIKSEIERQRALLDGGGTVVNQTRSWDAENKVTVAMRDKETVQDYRYMPEPNLPPLRLNLKTKDLASDVISVPLLKARIPKLPEDSRNNLMATYELRPETAIQIVNEPVLLKYFEPLAEEPAANAVRVANLLLNDVLTALNKKNISIENCPLTVSQLAELNKMLFEKQINLDLYRKTLDELLTWPVDTPPSQIIEKKGWLIVTDDHIIMKSCEEIIRDNPKLVKDYRDGKVKVFKALMGKLAKNSNNKLDMSKASVKMEELLKHDK